VIQIQAYLTTSARENKIPYTLGVIKESLRLFPSAIRPEIVCTADWTTKEQGGMSNKKGTKIVIAAWAANRNQMCMNLQKNSRQRAREVTSREQRKVEILKHKKLPTFAQLEFVDEVPVSS